MKKAYMKPTTDVVEFKTNATLLTGSLNLNSSTDPVNSDAILSRELEEYNDF